MVFAVPALVAVVAVVVVASVGSGHGAVPPPVSNHTTTTTTSTTTSTTSTTTTTLPVKGSAPVISALSPSIGAAGGQVTVSGSGFLSSDGHVIVRFNGAGVPTACPNLSECVATIPAGSGTAKVDIVTSGGASNTLTFTYG
jgi:hypothetical protein